MKKAKYLLYALLITSFIACNYSFLIKHQFRHVYEDANAFLHSDTAAAFLKAHMRNGDVYVLDKNWKVLNDSILLGSGIRYDFNRNKLESENFKIRIQDIAIFETNRPIQSRDADHIDGLTIVTLLDVILAVVCLTNPKACFGSCPTFYYQNDNNINYANAEGFSASIAPSLEAGDLDALNNPAIVDHQFRLTMKNEALETHAVNQVKLLAVPRTTGERVYNNKKGNFFNCKNSFPVKTATCAGLDISEEIMHCNDKEWYDVTDSTDLSAKETIELNFENGNHEQASGVLINFRQTLLTTFLLYSAYGYMGDEVGDLFAKIETDKSVRKNLSNPYQFLGGIEMFGFNEKTGSWQAIDTLYETGPIAKNLQLVSLPQEFKNQNNIRIRLVMSKGLWRLDYVSMTSVLNPVIPYEVFPYEVLKNGALNIKAQKNLTGDDDQYQISLPGDSYELQFKLPDASEDYELFVYSKGYYLEWIRGEWLKHKDLRKLEHMLDGDDATWKSLAKEFKSVEGTMEATFWNSKIVQ